MIDFIVSSCQDILKDTNKRPHFVVTFTALGLSGQPRLSLGSLGMVGDSDIKYQEINGNSVDSVFKAVVSLLRAKKSVRGGAHDGARDAFINLLRSLAVHEAD